jgi:DNA-binding CsgD family transcriptional regulator
MYARGGALAARCVGARTPGLVAAAGVVPLTRREREVAALAARGCPSKEITARLHLSIRTVDNHLQNAYAKLGVSRRNELSDALGTL